MRRRILASLISRHLAFLFLLAIALPIYSQGLQPGGPWTVVDSNDKVVGAYTGNNQDSHEVSMVINGIPVAIYASTGTSTAHRPCTTINPTVRAAL